MVSSMVRKAGLFLCLFAATMMAMAQNTATVRGTVTDPDGAAIPGAAITLTPASGAALHATSGGDGAYSVARVPAGTYTMTVTFVGFASFSQANVRVTAGQFLNLDAKLTIETTVQTVEVTAESNGLSVDADSNGSATVITGEALDALSDDPDELADQLSALAGPSAGPDGGQIYIDGFTGGQLPPKSSIREIRINQNPFSAQYDRPGFGRVEIFTKPGTDKFRGNMSIQGNTSAINTGNPFLNISATTGLPVAASQQIEQPGYYSMFTNGSLTGPLTKLSSFSTGGSYRHSSDNSIIKATILAPNANSTILCAPNAAGCFISTFNQAAPSQQNRWDINPRIDMQLSAKNTLTTRFGFFKTTSTASGNGINLNTTGSTSNNEEQTLQMSDNQTLSSRLINETRFEYQRDRSESVPTNPVTAISVQGNFRAGGNGSLSGSQSHSSHIELQNYTSLALSKNFIRFGGRLRWSNQASNISNNTAGSFTYSFLTTEAKSGSSSTTSSDPTNPSDRQTCALTSRPSVYECGTVNQYSRTDALVSTIRGSVADVGLYAESDWKARQNLTLSYGIRYETQNGLHDPADIAPRVSFAWGVGSKKGAPVTVIRGGFGIFYSRFGLNNVLTPIQNNGLNSKSYQLQPPPSGCAPGNVTGCTGVASPSNQTTTLSSDLRTPYAMSFQISDEIAPWRGVRLSFSYLRTNGEHQFYSLNSCAPNPTFTADCTYINPVNNQSAHYVRTVYQSGGIYRQNQFNITASISRSWLTLFGYTSFSFANTDANGFNSTPTNTAQGIISNYGRAQFSVLNRTTFGGNITLPYHISMSPLLQYQTGAPYNVTVGNDINQDTYYNDRPTFGTASELATYNSTPQDPGLLGATIREIPGCGIFKAPAVGNTTGFTAVPVNYCTGPNLFDTNLRLAKTWGFGKTIAPRTPRPGQGGPGGPGGGGPGGPGGGGFAGGGGGRGGGGGAPRGGGGGGGGRGANTGKRFNLTFSAQITNVFNITNNGNPSSSMASAAFGRVIGLAGGGFGSTSAKQRTQLQLGFNF